MATVNFYLEKRKNKLTGEIETKNVPIIMHFNFNCKRFQHYTGERIDADKWTDKKMSSDGTLVKVQKVKASVAGSMEVNMRLEKLADDVKRIYREAHIQDVVPTVQFIRENLPENQRSASVQFFDVFDKFIEMKRSISSKGTITKFKVIKKHLMKFSNKKRIKIEFDSIDKRLLQRFVDYQLHDCLHTNNTVAKNVNIIKWFLNWATDEEYNRNLKYKGFTLKEKFGKVIVLSWEELMHLYQMKISSIALKQVRDIFCFQCFTGFRYSDVRMLKKHNVKNDYINITTVKTKEEIQIPLNDYSSDIIKKYKNYPGDFLLPVISNQNMNEHLKELGKMAGFNERIEIIRYRGAERIVNTFYKYEVLTTHIGRKTFTTNNGRLGIPIELTMQMGGWKQYKTVKRYYDIGQEQLKDAMLKAYSKANTDIYSQKTQNRPSVVLKIV